MPRRVLRQCLLLALYLWAVCQSLVHVSFDPQSSSWGAGRSWRLRALAGSAYLMVLFVLRRIHWGMGRFCF